MKLLPKTSDPQVVRTDFEHQEAWEAICNLIRAPVHEFGNAFYAYVYFLDDAEFQGLSVPDLLTCLPDDYGHFFLFVVDAIAITTPEHPILAVDLGDQRGRSFRAIPSTVQSIQNNLSLANMDFFEFAESADKDGIFRGFPEP